MEQLKDYFVYLWDLYERLKGDISSLIIPSKAYPILWQGDSFTNKKKILTFQFAPSIYDFLEKTDTEGPQINRQRERLRFINNDFTDFNDRLYHRLLNSYDMYFYLNPYRNLFDDKLGKFERIAASFGGSYFSNDMTIQFINTFLVPFPILKDTAVNYEKAQYYLSFVENFYSYNHIKRHIEEIVRFLNPDLIIFIGEYVKLVDSLFKLDKKELFKIEGGYSINTSQMDIIDKKINVGFISWNYHNKNIPCYVLKDFANKLGYFEGVCIDEEEDVENAVYEDYVKKTVEYKDSTLSHLFDDLRIKIEGKGESELLGTTFIFIYNGTKWAIQKDSSVESIRYLLSLYEKIGIKIMSDNFREGYTKYGRKALYLYNEGGRRIRRFYCYLEKRK